MGGATKGQSSLLAGTTVWAWVVLVASAVLPMVPLGLPGAWLLMVGWVYLYRQGVQILSSKAEDFPVKEDVHEIGPNDARFAGILMALDLSAASHPHAKLAYIDGSDFDVRTFLRPRVPTWGTAVVQGGLVASLLWWPITPKLGPTDVQVWFTLLFSVSGVCILAVGVLDVFRPRLTVILTTGTATLLEQDTQLAKVLLAHASEHVRQRDSVKQTVSWLLLFSAAATSLIATTAAFAASETMGLPVAALLTLLLGLVSACLAYHLIRESHEMRADMASAGKQGEDGRCALIEVLAKSEQQSLTTLRRLALLRTGSLPSDYVRERAALNGASSGYFFSFLLWPLQF